MNIHKLTKNLEYAEIMKFLYEHKSNIKNFTLSKHWVSFDFPLYPYSFRKDKQLADLFVSLPHNYVTARLCPGPILRLTVKRFAEGSDFANCLIQLNAEE